MSAAQENGRPSHLECAVKAIDLIVQNKILHTKKDEIALILFGTRDTVNDLAADNQYQHITVAREMGLPDLNLLRYIENSIVPSGSTACFIDTLIVGMDVLIRASLTKKNPEMRLVMFTDAASDFNDDQVDVVVDGLKQRNIAVQVVGIDFGEDAEASDGLAYSGGDDNDGDDDNDLSPTQVRRRPRRRPHKHVDHAPRQVQGIQLLKQIVERVEGQLFSFDSALEMVSQFRKPSVRQVTVFRGPLEIADLKIPVWGYIRQRRAPLPTFKKLSGLVTYNPSDPNSGIVDRKVTYHLQNDEETEVDKTDLAKGFKFGGSFVPWLQEDEDNMKLKTEKRLAVICFTDTDKIPRHHYMGGNLVSFVPAQDDESAAVGLSALCESLYERNKVAVVRYVFRTNAAPKLGILFPHVKSDYVSLFFVQIPFREDIRLFQLPSLRRVKPTNAQLDAMDAFMQKMDLMTAYTDEDGEEMEALQPKLTFNPVIQHIYQCVHHRAMNPDAPIPVLDEMISKYVRTPEALSSKAEEEAAVLKAQFNLVRKADPRTRGTAARLWQQTDDGTSGAGQPKRARNIGTDAGGGSGDTGTAGTGAGDGLGGLSVSSLLRAEVTQVGALNPVDDYLNLVSRRTEDLLVDASKQLIRRIEDLVDVYIGGATGSFLQMVQVLRKHTLREEPSLFNDFFQTLCTTLRQQPIQRKPFLDELRENSITLISSEENPDSNVAPEMAATFWEAPAPTSVQPSLQEQPEDENLLDEL